ncbi:unnamed protein product [Protopolystoma xenopodis]|uniref:Uncharacterized protein n=1 Tax=Protopolystoma xenopodis TaxID=117903 RepID=A0A448WY78_9PLAT|nr:unnamed protein product [Protopolystoma xenopodis]
MLYFSSPADLFSIINKSAPLFFEFRLGVCSEVENALTPQIGRVRWNLSSAGTRFYLNTTQNSLSSLQASGCAQGDDLVGPSEKLASRSGLQFSSSPLRDTTTSSPAALSARSSQTFSALLTPPITSALPIFTPSFPSTPSSAYGGPTCILGRGQRATAVHYAATAPRWFARSLIVGARKPGSDAPGNAEICHTKVKIHLTCCVLA